MKDEKNIDELFKALEGQFDTETPAAGHEERFRARLAAGTQPKGKGISKLGLWQPYAAAAVLLVFLTVGYMLFFERPDLEKQVAQISPEISQTNLYFTGLIEEQVKQLQTEDSPLTRKVLEDAMQQLRILEEDYSRMERDLINGGDSALILSAMISNFQTRIELIKEVQEQIESIKNFNIEDNESISI